MRTGRGAVVDHAVANKLCRDRMGKAYAASKEALVNDVSDENVGEEKEPASSSKSKTNKRASQGTNGGGGSGGVGRGKKMKQMTLS